MLNSPWLDIGAITYESTSIDTRFQYKTFMDAQSESPLEYGGKIPVLPQYALRYPTLGDWEAGSGILEIECSGDKSGPAIIKIEVCNLLPQSLYSVWIMTTPIDGNPNYPSEYFSQRGPGGIGNVIKTDKNGHGIFEATEAHCPIRDCEANNDNYVFGCDIFMNVKYNPDYMIWGEAPLGLTWTPISYPPGVDGGNHLWWPLHGTLQQNPLNRYPYKES
eukprot:267430_1